MTEDTITATNTDAAGVDAGELLTSLAEFHAEFTQVTNLYQFGIDEVLTKVDILRREFENNHDYSPIEHVRSRLKNLDSIVEKAARIDCPLTMTGIREHILDIAGLRITCGFVSDVYWIAEMLTNQPDLTVVTTKDYIAQPKANGYRSLHMILQVPVFLSDRTEHVPVELQIRTMAMDFWASIEHKLSYKYDHDVPDHLREELAQAADIAITLDDRMGRLRDEVRPHPWVMRAMEAESRGPTL